jgi:hypothetical protein
MSLKVEAPKLMNTTEAYRAKHNIVVPECSWDESQNKWVRVDGLGYYTGPPNDWVDPYPEDRRSNGAPKVTKIVDGGEKREEPEEGRKKYDGDDEEEEEDGYVKVDMEIEMDVDDPPVRPHNTDRRYRY